ncbi:MAG: hypothetical protein U0359_17620 [Byssovorax sp.]
MKSPSAWLLLVSTLTLLTAGCSHDIQSPAPKATSAEPDLVCNDKPASLPFSTVTLHGDGFTPMPSKTLEDKRELRLPRIQLDQTQAIPGTMAGATTIQIADDPANPAASRVHWTSEQEMSFDILPEDKFTTGVFSITITNPDEKSKSTIDKGLAILPVPTLSAVEPPLLCDDQEDQQVVLTGAHFLAYGSEVPTITATDGATTKTYKPTIDAADCAALDGNFTEKDVRLCAKLTFTLPKGDFKETEPAHVKLTVTNPKPADCASTDPVELLIIPAPVVSMVKPPAICDDQSDQVIEITGSNFLRYGDALPSVTVGAPPTQHVYKPTFDEKDCKTVDEDLGGKKVSVCSKMTITIPKGDFVVAMLTELTLIVTNPEPANCSSSDQVKITIEPPPRVDTVIPATVCQGGSQITVGGEGFIDGATVTLDCMGTMINATAVAVAMGGKTLTATFGPGANPGSACDVIVTNPDGCQDRPPPHKQVTATTGPIVFFVDPPVVYNGINTRITIFATTITPPLPADAVTIVPSGQIMPVTQLAWNPVPGHPNRVQAIVPIGQAPGTYDVTLKDASGCFASLPAAIVVTQDLTVSVKSVNPPFGATAEDTAVTFFRDKAAPAPKDKPFIERPRVFLNPTNPMATDVAVEVESVSFVDADTATGVVPAGTPVHGYDVVLVNPDGSVGLLPNGYSEVQDAPPVVTGATPASIAASLGQVVILTGTSFAQGDVVSLLCEDAAGNPVASPNVAQAAPVCNGNACTQQITIDGSTLGAGDVCIARVTNPDGTYGEFSAIGVTTPSLNLNSPHVGTTMNVGRRALSAASGNATPAARFVYALGGDDGSEAGAFDSTEFAPVDLFGKMGAWTLQKGTLGQKRTLAGAITVGRYIYLAGGDDGMGPLDSAERALILSPRETPVIEDIDLSLGMKGLDQGEWHYRISATFDAADTDNPGGESLPSDAFSIKLPSIAGKKIAVTLVWKAPVDALGAPLAGVNGYRVYRTANAGDPPGSEVLIASIAGANVKTFADDGTSAPGAETPLPTGSTGRWLPLPKLAQKRSGLAVTAGNDPLTPNKFYVYALLGKTGAAAATGSYEYLPVTIAPNGRQTADAAWITGAQSSGTPRHRLGAWTATSGVSATITGTDTWIFLGGGELGNNTQTGKVEAGKIAAGGDLGAISDTPKDFSSTSSGYGVCAANGQLFVFGGQGGSPSSGAKSAELVAPPPTLKNNSWNSEGLTMTHGRYLMGSSVQSAFIFLLGGQTDEPAAASKTTELVIW